MSRKMIATRERILRAACNLLEARPHDEARVSDIAEAAGISRQALYAHFPTRAELLIAAVRHFDETKDVDARLVKSRNAAGGTQRLDAFIEAWSSYIPEVYGLAKALLAMKDTDEAAAAAWNDRMGALRHGCEAAVRALKQDGELTAGYSLRVATDILWTLLSFSNWESLTIDCGWSKAQYAQHMKAMARRLLVAQRS